MKDKVNVALLSLDSLWENFFICRSHFPAFERGFIGKKEIPFSPFYEKKGHSIKIVFSQPINEKTYEEIFRAGRWINKSFIINLWAALEFHKVVSNDKNNEKLKIDIRIEGGAAVDIVRRLRHRFSHSTGEFNPNDIEHRRTIDKMNEVLNLDYKIDKSENWPLDINRVLNPLFKDCKQYVKTKKW